MSDEWRRNDAKHMNSLSFWLKRMEMWSASRFPVLQCLRCTRSVWYQKCRRHKWEGMDRASRLVNRFANILYFFNDLCFQIRQLILRSQSWCHSQSLVGQVNDFISGTFAITWCQVQWACWWKTSRFEFFQVGFSFQPMTSEMCFNALGISHCFFLPDTKTLSLASSKGQHRNDLRRNMESGNEGNAQQGTASGMHSVGMHSIETTEKQDRLIDIGPLQRNTAVIDYDGLWLWPSRCSSTAFSQVSNTWHGKNPLNLSIGMHRTPHFVSRKAYRFSMRFMILHVCNFHGSFWRGFRDSWTIWRFLSPWWMESIYRGSIESGRVWGTTDLACRLGHFSTDFRRKASGVAMEQCFCSVGGLWPSPWDWWRWACSSVHNLQQGNLVASFWPCGSTCLAFMSGEIRHIHLPFQCV